MSAEPVPMLTEDSIRAAAPRVFVYNPTDYHQVVELWGLWYRFPPNDQIAIRDMYRYQTTLDKNKNAAAVKTLFDEPKKLVEPAVNIAFEICKPERMGPKGFIVLNGEPDDERRKLEARRRWIAFQLDDCRKKDAAYVAFLSNLPKGSPIPIQKPALAEAYRWLEAYKRGEIVVGPDQRAVDEHERFLRLHPEMREVHPEVMPALTSDEHEPEEGPEQEEPEAQVSAGRFLYLKAKEIGVKLSPEELEGLLGEQQETIDAVTKRIARKQARAAQKTAVPA
jgi:hypothetical protein